MERLWQACAASGDLYRKHYEGLYCVGCEQFYRPAELPGGLCPEHGTRPERVAEENWFFRLSRYAGQLHDLVSSGGLRIEPAARRNEVLGFIAGGLEDFSASRSTARARGWGIPVPGDPDQVIYVWWDALGNYITALGYGTGEAGNYRHWWTGADRRIHLVGKGVLRFHAVYWPAILLSAGEPLPTDILVHDYLTVGGSKISKSGAGGQSESADPVALAARYGTDAVRWWLLREVPRVGDADFTAARLVARANDDLANDLGNLVSRVVTLVHRYRQGEGTAGRRGARRRRPAGLRALAAAVPAPGAGTHSRGAGRLRLPGRHGGDLGGHQEANRYVERAEPWRLARAERDGDLVAGQLLDESLAVLVEYLLGARQRAGPVPAGSRGESRPPATTPPGSCPKPSRCSPGSSRPVPVMPPEPGQRPAGRRVPRRHAVAPALPDRLASATSRRAVLAACLAPPGQRRSPGGVGGGDQQAAEHGDVLEEVDALLRPVLVVRGLPEPVPGDRGGHQGRRDREGRKPRQPAHRQQRAGHDLDGAADPHRLLGIAGHGGHPLGDRPDHRLGPRGHPLGMQQGVEALDGEDGRQHRACDSS